MPHNVFHMDPELTLISENQFYFSSMATLPISPSIIFMLSNKDYTVWTFTGFLHMYVKLALKNIFGSKYIYTYVFRSLLSKSLVFTIPSKLD